MGGAQREGTSAALAFLGAYALPIIWPDLDRPWTGIPTTVVVFTWILFGVDYAVRLWTSDDRRQFFVWLRRCEGCAATSRRRRPPDPSRPRVGPWTDD